MSTIRETTELGPVTARPLETYWNAFQEWRKRQRLANLCDLSNRELMDIGITRSEIDYVASNRGIDPRGIRTFLIVMVCTACVLPFSSEARAQCTARDVLQNQLRLKKSPSVSKPQILVRSAVDVPVWKTIRVPNADIGGVRHPPQM
ncbi:DUF1127 domain-containing protein [Bradyrhizobium sp. AUGA SZCCT0222]|uniref:DUF1127 domain-containing protein n=1 Tax=Bradyrhizobium sp. AUGA SZCCT0222 TaxID=2807668 RepID=UPI0020120DA9|nr:DUF1127 domain-containing protein [Bradyrhizobium sp. AUGA SZCCT0222]